VRRRPSTVLLMLCVVLIGAAGCDRDEDSAAGSPEETAGDLGEDGNAEDGDSTAEDGQIDATIEVTSTVLRESALVPEAHTCEGTDVAPELSWRGVPEDAVEVVVIVDDPDASSGTFVHWTVWGLEPGDDAVGPEVPGYAAEGTNDFGELGYLGPCPPEGDEAHRYRFRVLAVSERLDLRDGAEPQEVTRAVEGLVVAEGSLTATYER
jgi:Raf kinase inhibitor-like YbhB/YbcL family protein